MMLYLLNKGLLHWNNSLLFASFLFVYWILIFLSSWFYRHCISYFNRCSILILLNVIGIFYRVFYNICSKIPRAISPFKTRACQMNPCLTSTCPQTEFERSSIKFRGDLWSARRVPELSSFVDVLRTFTSRKTQSSLLGLYPRTWDGVYPASWGQLGSYLIVK